MDSRHVLEKLQATNPQAEIWWDSAPMFYTNWAKKVLDKAPADKKELWNNQLSRLFDPQRPEHTFFRGVTTNPPLRPSASFLWRKRPYSTSCEAYPKRKSKISPKASRQRTIHQKKAAKR